MDQWQQIASQFRVFSQQFPNFLVSFPWAWWAAGIGIGLTAVALAWFMGKKLGVTGGFEDACSVVTGNEKDFTPSESHLVPTSAGSLISTGGVAYSVSPLATRVTPVAETPMTIMWGGSALGFDRSMVT